MSSTTCGSKNELNQPNQRTHKEELIGPFEKKMRTKPTGRNKMEKRNKTRRNERAVPTHDSNTKPPPHKPVEHHFSPWNTWKQDANFANDNRLFPRRHVHVKSNVLCCQNIHLPSSAFFNHLVSHISLISKHQPWQPMIQYRQPRTTVIYWQICNNIKDPYPQTYSNTNQCDSNARKCSHAVKKWPLLNQTIIRRRSQGIGTTTRCAHLYTIEHVVCERTRHVVCGSREVQTLSVRMLTNKHNQST